VILLSLEHLDAAHLLAAVRAYRSHFSEAPPGLARLENMLMREVAGDRNGQQMTGRDAAPELVAPAGYGQTMNGALLTVAEAARWARVSKKTVLRRIKTGELPATRIGAGPRAPLRIDPAKLKDFLHGASGKPPADGAADLPRSPQGGPAEDA
jgi:excisionase family DNA binding protein